MFNFVLFRRRLTDEHGRAVEVSEVTCGSPGQPSYHPPMDIMRMTNKPSEILSKPTRTMDFLMELVPLRFVDLLWPILIETLFDNLLYNSPKEKLKRTQPTNVSSTNLVGSNISVLDCNVTADFDHFALGACASINPHIDEIRADRK